VVRHILLPSSKLTKPSRDTISDTHRQHSAYIAEHSLLRRSGQRPGSSGNDSTTVISSSHASHDFRIQVLRASEADQLPRQPMRQALFDAFFTRLRYAYPIVNREEVESQSASILLQQAVCFAGSLVRHPSLPDSFARSNAIYEKLKLLICLEVEPDMLVVLKALSLLMLWSPHTSNVVSLDSCWQTTGNALRLAFQMGMHQSSTYRGNPNAKCQRRLWWLLYVRALSFSPALTDLLVERLCTGACIWSATDDTSWGYRRSSAGCKRL
jgi:hypothetical protein